MKIVEKKKINEGVFINSISDIDKFFTKIDIASDLLDDGIESEDDYLEEFAKLMGAYIATIQNELVENDQSVNIKPVELQKAFLKGYNAYLK
jgi:hypothetical protein